MIMMNTEAFARDWINAWNSHDSEAILNHYATDIVFTSPFVAKLNNMPDGTLRGREMLRDYFSRGLQCEQSFSGRSDGMEQRGPDSACVGALFAP
jgi:ketosteroid isomerase-like protein